MIHKKLLSLLVLLMTAATGAWAEEVTVTFTPTDLNGSGTVTKDGVTLTPGNGDARVNANFYHRGSNTFSVDKGTFTKIEIVDCSYVYPANISGWQKIKTGSYRPYPEVDPDYWEDLYTLTWTGEAESVSFTASVYEIQSIVFTIYKPEVDVTTNKAQGETTFTEATFAMPAFDATANYDIVRDMSDATYPVEFSGITERIIVKKGSDEKYQPVSTLTIQLIDELAATDARNIIKATGIKVYVLRGKENSTGGIDYDETKPIPYDDFTTNWQPGLYMLVAVPTDATTSPYTGTASLTFEALAGFPVEVAAKEYVTYYSATDNLALEENAGAKLYTITAVSGSTATATEITSANAEMPFLLYNPTDVTKTFLLIPTDAEINQSFYGGFKGTTEATTIPASTDGLNNYAFNGKKFIWVMEALPVAANKAWLAIPTELNARTINLVFDDGNATGLDGVTRTAEQNGDYYDLNGRKLDKKPTRKGVYIQNGRKVVIK